MRSEPDLWLEGELPWALEPNLCAVGSLAHQLGDDERPRARRVIDPLVGASRLIQIGRSAADAPVDVDGGRRA